MDLSVILLVVFRAHVHSHPVVPDLRLLICLKLFLFQYNMCANSESSGEIVQMRRRAWAIPVPMCDIYHFHMSLLLYSF